MYYNSRAGLEDRVWRIKSGMSSASTPLPRTWHAVHNIRLGKEEGESIEVFANWQSHAFKEGETRTFYGRSEYQLKKIANELKISKKMVLLINDVIPSVLDIYNI
jgi:3-phenylpropionate/cinnamic acid dioxygenase small subunit